MTRKIKKLKKLKKKESYIILSLFTSPFFSMRFFFLDPCTTY